ncbi:TetR/AcrR family transcriptional regulator [Pseudomonas sp. CBMAI 2609]|uniref:TetR/AcrR family transcriptional regulator n=1 Tax=Pseudomonas flavocrustae TaxID=2991719 RepID=A0ABT6II54_9PSED|nr:TetR/AcrR family transcriptional regulator [Pseudomonas sp. CBMAI 2609]MDH4764167.1 TetR/AcrR family transcriptional regulator [Pseudomonas sp. CBMAI 2609]
MTNDSALSGQARGPADHDVRFQIMVSAKEHFSRYGYEKTTVSELARSIGFSKAYIYKFFDSKQAIGEAICKDCLQEIESEARAAIATVSSPSEKLRRLFQSLPTVTLRLFSDDRKLYEIAIYAASGRWPATITYENHVKELLKQILIEGRSAGDFERKTPIDDVALSAFLVLRPYLNPLLLQHSFDDFEVAPTQLANLVLRSLAL